ncbi:MAG: pantetheine-phosphate adenylyltransferase [Alphaproteobacteria bacterium]|nr:pantetheine-phosphate adenylyltransferase [Alphaproteobacteria bacterium]
MGKNRIGIYPGTFDPITNGHIDIITRAMKFLDEVIVGVAENAGKDPMFSLEERVQMVEEEIAALNGGGNHIRVIPFSNLLMDFAIQNQASVILRGLRAVSDFEYEFQMAGMNARIHPAIETVFLMASERHQFISSRLVKEVGRLGGDISHFVSPRVLAHMQVHFENGDPKKLIQTFEEN